jgi:uncharacterized membrane protein
MDKPIFLKSSGKTQWESNTIKASVAQILVGVISLLAGFGIVIPADYVNDIATSIAMIILGILAWRGRINATERIK